MRRLIGCGRGNWAGRYAGILAVLATLLAAAPASAWGWLDLIGANTLRFSKVDHFPTTYAQPVPESSALAQRLTTMLYSTTFMQWMRDEIAEYDPKILNDKAAVQFVLGPKRWSEVAMPPALRNTLKGVQLYLMWGQPDMRVFFGVRGTRMYELPDEVSQLLFDSGLRFRVRDVPIWAVAAVYAEIVATSFGTYGLTPLDWRGQACLDSLLTGQVEVAPGFSVSGFATDTAPPGASDYEVPAGWIRRVRLSVHADGWPWRVDGEVNTMAGQGKLRGMLLPADVDIEMLGRGSRLSAPRVSLDGPESIQVGFSGDAYMDGNNLAPYVLVRDGTRPTGNQGHFPYFLTS